MNVLGGNGRVVGLGGVGHRAAVGATWWIKLDKTVCKEWELGKGVVESGNPEIKTASAETL